MNKRKLLLPYFVVGIVLYIVIKVLAGGIGLGLMEPGILYTVLEFLLIVFMWPVVLVLAVANMVFNGR